MSRVVWYIGGCYCKVVSLGRYVWLCLWLFDRIGYSWDCTCSKWSVCLFIHTVMLSVPAVSKVCYLL